MTLGVDRALPGSLSPMETKGCSRRWKTGIPVYTHNSTAMGMSPTQNSRNTDQERGRDREREKGGARKSVTMAPTSRYLTDRRQYVVRKPLFSTEQQTSILKKSNTQERPEMERQWRGIGTEACHQHTDIDFYATRSEEVTQDGLNFSQATISPFSTEDLTSSLGVSDLRSSLNHEEATIGSPCVGTGSSRRNFSSPPLEVHHLTSPISPRLTSTLLSPTYTPNPRHSRSRPTELRLGGRGGEGGQTHLSSSIGNLKGRVSPALHTMSPHQANYWACAIPKALPPSPDRRSPGWDPDREYQALLDYTYPLRPGRVVSEWDSSELRGGSLVRTDPGLQDSGIELDRLCSSTNLSGLDLPLSGAGRLGTRHTRERGTLGVGQRLSEQRGLSKSSDGLLSSSPFSSTDPISLYLESLDCSKDRGRTTLFNRNKGVSHHRQHGMFAPSYSSSNSAPFIRSTSILPRPGCVGGREVDEEYRPLPDQLEELQVLSRQVREVTAQLGQPVTASWESLERGTASVHSSTTLAEKQEAEGEEHREEEGGGQENEEKEEDAERGERCGYETPVFHNKAVQRDNDSSQAVGSPGPRMEPVGRGVSRASLRDVEALMDQLSGLSLPDLQRGSQMDLEHTDSLMNHIQIFCSNLEELIRWLYTVVERMEMLTPPTVDIESVKSSLAEYQSFQRELSAHQPLTSSVLQTGERLLSCMNTTSPVLQDTLSLIERQSRVLETHTEHLFSSILSAMDSLTRPSQTSQPKGPESCGGLEAGVGDLATVEVRGAEL